MVDKERRKKLAFHLRQLAAGRVTNEDFESAVADDVTYGWLPEQYYRSKEAKNDDPVMLPMLLACWGLYDDTRMDKLTGSAELTREAKTIIARCILFLLSDREYEWPYFNAHSTLFRFLGSIGDIILTILTLGLHFIKENKRHLAAYEAWKNAGDYDVWPFFRSADYQEQLVRQPFLKANPA
jgi:hypothetical protein